MNGLETATSGTLSLFGRDVTRLTEAEWRVERRQIGMVFQHFNLLSSRTVFDNIALPLEIAGTSRSEIGQRVGDLLELVGLADKRARYPVELSGGQKQRVGIARALATERASCSATRPPRRSIPRLRAPFSRFCARSTGVWASPSC